LRPYFRTSQAFLTWGYPEAKKNKKHENLEELLASGLIGLANIALAHTA